jgi:hypothetical protein
VTRPGWVQRDRGEERTTAHGELILEPRPHYCDRGRWTLKVFPKHGANCSACNVDDADSFPRYYFDHERRVGKRRPVREASGSFWLLLSRAVWVRDNLPS